MMKAIFLSASIPDSTQPHFVGPSDPIDVIEAVRALVYIVLGRRRLVWGGHPAITPIVWSVASSHKVDYGKWAVLYQSLHFGERFPDDNKQFKNTRYVEAATGTDTQNEEEQKSASLKMMRHTMFSENEFETAIFIGGMEGIFQEFEMFGELCPNARRIPLISTGGAARELPRRLSERERELDLDRLARDVDYIPLLSEICNINLSEPRETIA